MQRQILFAVLASLVLVGATASQSWAQPSSAVCASGNEGYTEICVRFDNFADAPEVGYDFTFDVATDPANPSVVLLRGDDGLGTMYEWRVWSHDARDDPANIGSISSPGAYDYRVKIRNPDNSAGAANVGFVDLTPAGDHHSSIGTVSIISGNLTGGLELFKDAEGNGGRIG